MSVTAPARYVSNGMVEVLAYPYLGERLEFLILLPAPNWFERFIQQLSGDTMLGLLSGLGPVEAEITLPRFSVESRWDLEAALRGLGIEAAFTEQAGFGGISSEPLRIDSIAQAARMDVDEEGTRADVVTEERWVWVGIPPEVPEILFVVDRPFLFAIWDRETRTILFFGHVVDPR
jgi:serpin B